jgi:signal transduction histidine kinase
VSVAVEELRAIELFDGVPDEQLAAWAAAAEERWLEPGDETLPHDELTHFTLLLEGRLDGYVIRDGREEWDHTHNAPTFLGAIIALTQEPARVSIRAAGRCRIATIEPEAFKRLLFDTPVAFQRVMRTFRPVFSRFEAADAQREKLAALGQMSAGLAHELNNPTAAARRSALALSESLGTLSTVVHNFVDSGVEREEAAQLVELHDEAVARAKDAPKLDAMALADAEDAVAALLERHGIADAWQLTEPLVAAGLDDAWLQRVEALAGPATPAAVRWVATSLTAHSLAEDLCDSTDRMTKLVKAIKAYTYMDQDGLQEIDVHEGLESTLVMLHHKLKHTHIQVEKRYAEQLPRVCVYGSELNQVWTNLLDNAIDALGEQGTITIGTAPWHETGVEITISDDGPGIDPDAQRRVFEPFFTTKSVGSGTGLGLDAARRIIRDRHQGDILLASQPGSTTFTVRLPRAPRKH